MVMESNDQHKVRCSTSALLQERFRQLERVKEMREERALLKLLPECEQYYGTRGSTMMTNKYYIVDEPSRLFFHSEIIHSTTCRKPPPSQQLVHLSLWPNSEIHHHRHHHHHHHTNSSNYFGSNATTKMSNSITKSWLKDAPLTGSNCSIKVDNMTSSTATATHDVDTSLHL